MRNKLQKILIGIGLLWGPILANSSTINTINVGSSANDGTGDTLRAAFQKVNSNDAALNADKVENSNGSASGLTLSGTTTIGGTLDVSSATTLTGLDSPDEIAEGLTRGEPSLWFNGSNEWVSVADNANLSFTDGTDDLPFSVSAWVKFDDLADNGIIAKYSTAASVREWRFDFTATDKLELAIRDTSSVEARVQSAALTSYAGQWIHVAATYDGAGPNSSNDFNAAADGIQLYLNGNSITGTAATFSGYAGMSDTSQDVWIGRYGGIYGDGEIRNVQIFNSALTAAQVEQVYRSGVPYELSGASVSPVYTQNTSGGTDGWQALRLTATGNVDSISDGSTTKNDTLRLFASSDAGSTHFTYRSSTFDGPKGVRVTGYYYIPSANTNVDGLAVAINNSGSTPGQIGSNLTTTGTWTYFSIHGNLSGDQLGRLTFALLSGGNDTFTGAGVVTDDLVYLHDVNVYETGAILDLNAADASGTNLADRSGNFSATLNSMSVAANAVNLPAAVSTYHPNPASGEALLTLGNGGSGADFAVDEDWSGTWSPGIAFGSGSTGLTYAQREGYYNKVGQTIVATFYIELSAKGSSTGSATITGLPVKSKDANSGGHQGGAIARADNMTSLTSVPTGLLNNNANTIVLYDWGATGVTSITEANFTDTSILRGTITYLTD